MHWFIGYFARMYVYFEYYNRRRRAEVTWPKNDETIVVRLVDAELIKDMPEDLYFEIENNNQVIYTVEDIANKRLTELQKVLARRLQEFANQR